MITHLLPPASEGWGTVLFSVCQSTPQLGGRGGTPSQVRTRGGHTSQVTTGGSPFQVRTGVPPSQVRMGLTHPRSGQWGGGGGEEGTAIPGQDGGPPPPSAGWVPTPSMSQVRKGYTPY